MGDQLSQNDPSLLFLPAYKVSKSWEMLSSAFGCCSFRNKTRHHLIEPLMVLFPKAESVFPQDKFSFYPLAKRKSAFVSSGFWAPHYQDCWD